MFVTRRSWPAFIDDYSKTSPFYSNTSIELFEKETGKSVVDDYEDFFRYLAAMSKKAFNLKKNYQKYAFRDTIKLMNAFSLTELFFLNVDRDSEEFKSFWRILSDTVGKRLPDGEIVGYKKAIAERTNCGFTTCIVKLRIPKDAKRSKAFGTKCRCDKAFVEDIYHGEEHYDIALSSHDETFKYKLGEWVSVDNFDDCPWIECSSGIHFFENEDEAYCYFL